MAISEKILNRTETAIRIVRDSRVPAAVQDAYIALLCDARDLTNGLPHEEKLQATTELIASLVFLYVGQAVQAPERPTTWKDVVIRCRREIGVIVSLGLVAAVYVLKVHPEIVQYLSLLKH